MVFVHGPLHGAQHLEGIRCRGQPLSYTDSETGGVAPGLMKIGAAVSVERLAHHGKGRSDDICSGRDGAAVDRVIGTVRNGRNGGQGWMRGTDASYRKDGCEAGPQSTSTSRGRHRWEPSEAIRVSATGGEMCSWAGQDASSGASQRARTLAEVHAWKASHSCPSEPANGAGPLGPAKPLPVASHG